MKADRPSKYLLDKVANMSGALHFFWSNEQSNKNSLKEKRLVFLSQIDFWDWEMETLIFSFSNFEDRSKAWTEPGQIELLLRSQGILVSNSSIRSAGNLPWNNRWKRRGVVYAPIKELNDCIETWNMLLAACEETVILHNVDDMINLGGNFIHNLDKYRKKPL